MHEHHGILIFAKSYRSSSLISIPSFIMSWTTLSPSGQVVGQDTCSFHYIGSHQRCKKESALVYFPSLGINVNCILNHPSCPAKLVIINLFLLHEFPPLQFQKGLHQVCLQQEHLVSNKHKWYSIAIINSRQICWCWEIY